MIGVLLLVAAAADEPNSWDRAEVAKMAHYAKCVAQVEGKDARAYALSSPGSDDERRLGWKLASDHPGCLQQHGISIMSGDAIHGLVADYLLRRETLMGKLAARAPIPPSRPAVGLGRSAFFHAYARCLFEAEPAKTAAILQTVPGSDEEKRSVMAYGQLLSGCMPTDLNYRLNATELRVNLATAAYRATAGAQRSVS